MDRWKTLIGKYKVFIPLLISNYIGTKKNQYPRTKFLVLSRSRTGSTMLMNYLKKVPNSYVQMELMGRKGMIPFWEHIPKLVFGPHRKKISIAGFKYFYYHPVDDHDAIRSIYKYIFSNPDVKVIHWRREDLFAVIISRYIALETGKWAQTKKETKINPFTIDVKEFEYELEETLAHIIAIRRLFEGYENYIELTYEDITKRGKLNELFKFLGVEGCQVDLSSKSSQRSKNKYIDILNIDELKAVYDKSMNVENR